MKRFAICFTLWLLPWASSAQPKPHDPTLQKEAMEHIDFLVGTWEGKGRFQMGPQGRHQFLGFETVESRLDGLILVVEGRHKDSATGEIVHHAFATIDWDETTKNYRFRSLLSDGRSADSVGTFEDGKFVWAPPGAPPGMEMRYVIEETETGEWFEVGEMSRDGGKTWMQFFEMRLRRTSG